jgi:subtilisin family serine protease
MLMICLLLMLAASAEAQNRRSELASRARERGQLRVIARLVLPEEAEPGSAPGSPRRHAAIEVAQNALLAQLGDTRGRRVRRLRRFPLLALDATPAVLAALEDSPWVAALEEDRLLSPTLTQSVPLIEADIPESYAVDGRGVAIAVLDTGVDLDHGFLEGAVVGEACFSAGGDCPNGEISQLGSGAGVHCTYADGCDHGTHVAGIALGAGSAFSGVAPGASLVSVGVFSRATGVDCAGEGENPCALAYVSDIVEGIGFVLDVAESLNVAVVNVSIGGGRWFDQATCDLDNPSLATAIAALRAAGIAPVVSAGNDGYTDSTGVPACITGALSVGATDDTDAIASFSNSASSLSLLAPGVGIESSVPSVAPALVFESWSGTSMAAPHVSGAWAILKQYQPLLDADRTLALLQDTGLPLTDTNGVTTPRIRVWPAVLAAPVGPECSDSFDNDEDGWIDYPDDPECAEPSQTDESRAPGTANPPLSCGLGAELVLALAPLLWLRRRRRGGVGTAD